MCRPNTAVCGDYSLGSYAKLVKQSMSEASESLDVGGAPWDVYHANANIVPLPRSRDLHAIGSFAKLARKSLFFIAG
jgi:hypothetical protein